jgi:hypothetical protein
LRGVALVQSMFTIKQIFEDVREVTAINWLFAIGEKFIDHKANEGESDGCHQH